MDTNRAATLALSGSLLLMLSSILLAFSLPDPVIAVLAIVLVVGAWFAGRQVGALAGEVGAGPGTPDPKTEKD